MKVYYEKDTDLNLIQKKSFIFKNFEIVLFKFFNIININY